MIIPFPELFDGVHNVYERIVIYKDNGSVSVQVEGEGLTRYLGTLYNKQALPWASNNDAAVLLGNVHIHKDKINLLIALTCANEYKLIFVRK